MKILFTNTGSWGTGSFTAIDAIAKELLKLGHQVKIFFPDAGIDSPDKEYYYSHSNLYVIWRFPIKTFDVELSTFPLMIADPNPRVADVVTFKQITQKQLQLYMRDFSINIQRVIDEFKPDIIESEHIWLMGYLLNKLGYKYFIGAHMSDQLAFDYDERMQLFAIKAAQHAQLIFAVAHHVKDNILKKYNLPAEKIEVIPNGYDNKVFKPYLTQRNEVLQMFNLQIPLDAKIITFVGKISLTKGIDILIKANQLIDKKNRPHFLIFGSGKLADVFNDEEIKNYDLSNMHFLGHQPPEKLVQAHNIADLYVAPSRFEGLAIALLEAMACGLPVIATQGHDAEDFVVGEIIAQENPRALANAIIKILLLSSEEHNNLSKQAFTKVQKFSWEYVTQQRLNFYTQSLLNK